jgi:hypothetical protein
VLGLKSFDFLKVKQYLSNNLNLLIRIFLLSKLKQRLEDSLSLFVSGVLHVKQLVQSVNLEQAFEDGLAVEVFTKLNKRNEPHKKVFQ